MSTVPERRALLRRRSLKTGRIVFNERRSVMNCIIRNFSDVGACLEVPSSVGIPTAFDLTIEPDGVSRRCTVRWRSDQRIGVSFG